MGGGASSDASSNEKKKKDKEIADLLASNDNDEKKTKKILLLGSGECGKTTILKQFKIIMADGFSEDEKKQFGDICRRNCLTAIISLINAVHELKIEPAFGAAEAAALTLKADFEEKVVSGSPVIESNDQLEKVKEDIKSVWKEECIQNAFNRKSEFQLLDSTEYFLTDDPVKFRKYDGNDGKSNLDRIFSENFSPNNQDILRARIMTTGVQQTQFTYEDPKEKQKVPITFRVFDVGGQRGERKRWIHCFDDVTAILFIASLSEYNQKLLEDDTRNRLDESLDLFEGIVNLAWFAHAAIILFLNKSDLFEQKILKGGKDAQMANVNGANWKYEGEDENVEQGIEFIQKEYYYRNEDDERQIYPHVTNATDTDQVTVIWKAVTQLILTNKFKDAGML